MKRKNKNAFTLIELLAVIVILAIIALIATPIILGIVEDARRDAFMRSVELVISSTDLDVMNKLTDTGHEYTLVDGMILDTEPIINYEINKEACVEYHISDYSQSEEDATTICNNEPTELNNNLTFLEAIEDSYYDLQELTDVGVITVNYDYNDLNLAKNTEGMNGNIIYNASGKEVYAIHNGLYCVTKKSNMEKAEVNDYVEGNCSANIEATDLTFQEFLDLDTFKGDKTTSGNGQLINLGEYGIRYQGEAPANRVYFNCSDYSNQSAETCETWRIIGVVDGKVKIIRSMLENYYPWNDQDGDASNDSGIDINDWNSATLKTYLNGEYYEGLTDATKELISPSTWYLRGVNTTDVTRNEMYKLERETGTIMHGVESISDTNIGLMYPSDYGYTISGGEDCPMDFMNNSWMWIGNAGWTITPYSVDFNKAINIEVVVGLGYMTGSKNVSYYANSGVPSGSVLPTLYLKNDVQIIDGKGTSDEPYQLNI